MSTKHYRGKRIFAIIIHVKDIRVSLWASWGHRKCSKLMLWWLIRSCHVERCPRARGWRYRHSVTSPTGKQLFYLWQKLSFLHSFIRDKCYNNKNSTAISVFLYLGANIFPRTQFYSRYMDLPIFFLLEEEAPPPFCLLHKLQANKHAIPILKAYSSFPVCLIPFTGIADYRPWLWVYVIICKDSLWFLKWKLRETCLPFKGVSSWKVKKNVLCCPSGGKHSQPLETQVQGCSSTFHKMVWCWDMT